MNEYNVHMISYGDSDYSKAKARIKEEASSSGFFKTIQMYSPNDLTVEFKDKYADILNKPRGGGYWIWKFDIILQRLSELNENDYLVYIDAGCTINKEGHKRFNEYIDLLHKSEYGIISFQMPHYEIQWTIQELFDALLINPNGPIGLSGQYVGGILIMKKNQHLYKVLNKCISILDTNKYLVSDNYNNHQLTYFIDNRHDQSLLSIVRKLYGSIILKDETYAYDSFNVIKDENCIKYPFLATRNKSINSIIL